MYIVQVQIHVGLHVGYIFVPLIREKSQYEIEDKMDYFHDYRTTRGHVGRKKTRRNLTRRISLHVHMFYAG